MPISLLRFWYKLIKKSPASMPMVDYWKRQESVQAKVTETEDGQTIMIMEGEKHPFPGFPRGHLLFGKLSKLKHEIKNQIFNESWWNLEKGAREEDVVKDIKYKLHTSIAELSDGMKYERVPYSSMSTSVRELHRAWTRVSPETAHIRDYFCMVLQEDDGYRFRMMDVAEYFNPNKFWKQVYRFITRKSYRDSILLDMNIALGILEHCEVVDDMKERARLLRRILMVMLNDKNIGDKFEKMCREINWKKVFMTDADRYFMRGKYYKADYRLFEY